MSIESQPSNHWSEYAKRWRMVASPFKPVEQDLGFYWDAAAEWIRRRGAPRVLLLGVTPQLYHLPWPRETTFLAVDRNQAMIDVVWQGRKEDAKCANWLDLSLPDGSRDIVLCDGGLEVLSYQREQQQLVRIIRNVLSDQGLCIFRLYVLPTPRESPSVVLGDMLGGRIPTRAVLELRLAMALQESATEGVVFRKVWQSVHEVAPDLKELAGRTGWQTEDTLELDVHRESTVRCCYTTLEQVRELFCDDPGGFKLDGLRTPGYVLGERCPTIVCRRCASAPAGGGSRKERS